MVDTVSTKVTQKQKLRLSSGKRDALISIASPIALLLVWEICARAEFIDVRFFPAPSSIFVALGSIFGSGELLTHTLSSLRRLLFGFVIGGIPAVVLGIAMGLSPITRAVFNPLIAATYPVPKSSILPLALLIFGLGESSKIFMVAIGVFFPLAINTTAGVAGIPKIYLDVGRNFKASRWQTFRTIALPGALPMIMTGAKLGVGLGLILIAVAEMVGSESGLGYMIWNAWETFSVERMYVGLFVIALIGFVLTVSLDWLERVLVPWRER